MSDGYAPSTLVATIDMKIQHFPQGTSEGKVYVNRAVNHRGSPILLWRILSYFPESALETGAVSEAHWGSKICSEAASCPVWLLIPCPWGCFRRGCTGRQLPDPGGPCVSGGAGAPAWRWWRNLMDFRQQTNMIGLHVFPKDHSGS